MWRQLVHKTMKIDELYCSYVPWGLEKTGLAFFISRLMQKQHLEEREFSSLLDNRKR